MIELVLGGARSGKSRYAEQQALSTNQQVIYIATAKGSDFEMQARIAHHRERRPVAWQTVEEPVRLAAMIRQHADPDHCLVIDCFTLWPSNILFDRHGGLQEALFARERALLETITQCQNRVILVSNEVGMGVVAADAMTRRFVDEAGFLHKALTQICDQVVLVTAGLAQRLKTI